MTRNPIVVFVLSIVTFGGFYVYWHWRTNEAMRARGGTVRPAVSALAVSWGALVLGPALASCYLTAERVRDEARRWGRRGPLPGLALVLILVLSYAPYVQWHLNRIPRPEAAAVS